MDTLARGKNPGQQDSTIPGALDLAYIRRDIPIETVARMLDLDVQRHFATCFRPENHPNGDSHPSLHFLTRKNCATCFRCDTRAMSNIDLVMGVLGCDFKTALHWFRKEFNLPTLRGRPAGLVQNKPFRVGLGGELEGLIRSGVYATLTEKAVRVLDVILHLRADSGHARLSYPELRRYTGIASDSTVKRALDELLRIHILERHDAPAVGSLRPAKVYVPTFQHTDLIRLMHDTYEKNRDSIAQEIDYYRVTKLERRRKRGERTIS